MKKYVLVLSLLCLSVTRMQASNSRSSCDPEIVNKTYNSGRPPFYSVSPELISGFRSDMIHARECGYDGAVAATLFGGKSTNSDNLANYFLPFGKLNLTVGTNVTAVGESQDLLADHFNIFTQTGMFRSRFTIEPKQSIVGLGLQYKQGFWRNEDKGRGLWFGISFPITRVRNTVTIKEIVEDDGGGVNSAANDGTAVANMEEAFRQQTWQFSRIDDKKHSETKVGDVEIKLGYEWLDQVPVHLESYLGMLVPAGSKIKGRLLFEPQVGWGQHWGIMFGSAAGVQIWCDDERDRNLRIELAGHSQYLFKKKQVRTLNLIDKQWSRFIELYANLEQAQQAAALAATDPLQAQTLFTPGINILTRDVDVTPGYQYNMTTAFVYTSCGFQAEAGYNFFTRRAECIKLSQPWQEGPAIKHFLGAGQTNPIRDMTGNFRLENTMLRIGLEFYNDNVIKETELDLLSASTPCLLSYTLYGALGYRWDDREFPVFVNGGGSYEFSNSNNAVIDRWLVWGKFGVSF